MTEAPTVFYAWQSSSPCGLNRWFIRDALKTTIDNRAISTMQVIEELIRLAKDLDAATKRGEDLGLTDDEIGFYDALASNNGAAQVMVDEKLKLVAAELITQVKKSVTIDWPPAKAPAPR
jgi:type I site-specific restriction-modification system R (restriction) subunit